MAARILLAGLLAAVAISTVCQGQSDESQSTAPTRPVVIDLGDAIDKIDLPTPPEDLIAADAQDTDDSPILLVEFGGDNALPDVLPAFAAAYEALLDAVNARASLACLGTYWEDPGKDAVIKASCGARDRIY